MAHSPGRGPSINHLLLSVKKWVFGMLPWDSLANLCARELLHVPWQLSIDKEWKINSQLGPLGMWERQMVLWSLWSYLGIEKKIVSKFPWARNAFQENLKCICNLILPECEGFGFKPQSSKTHQSEHELKAYSNFRAMERGTKHTKGKPRDPFCHLSIAGEQEIWSSNRKQHSSDSYQQIWSCNT